jgi:hypothetical protein
LVLVAYLDILVLTHEHDLLRELTPDPHRRAFANRLQIGPHWVLAILNPAVPHTVYLGFLDAYVRKPRWVVEHDLQTGRGAGTLRHPL